MASDSRSHATGPRARPTCNKVTAQHTLERVRNNQRRHRARRKDYIATLEEKLSQAEQSAKTLQDQVDTLQAELAQYRSLNRQMVKGSPLPLGQLQSDDSGTSPAPIPSPEEANFQVLDFLPDAADLDTLTPSSLLPFPLPFPDNLPSGLGPELFDVISAYARPKDANGPAEYEVPQALVPLTQSPKNTIETPLAAVLGSTGSAQDLAQRSLLSATASSEPVPIATGTCCSDRHSWKPKDDKRDGYAMSFSPESPPLLPEYVFHPPVPAHFRYSTHYESTILCAEAYLLIAQQNFKGINQKDVATWLWKGFRRSLNPGEGCRVKTDLLFSLLEFISDA